MRKHSKEFGLKGQREQTDSLETVLSSHMRRTTKAVYGGKTLDSVRYRQKEFGTPPAPSDLLTELLRDGARFLIAAAVQDELQQFMDSFKHNRLLDGKASVVRNGEKRLLSIEDASLPVPLTVK